MPSTRQTSTALSGPRVTGPRVTGPRVTGPRVTGARAPRTVLAATGVALALALSACGSSDATPAAAPASSVQGVATTHNDADVTFVSDMAPHHSGAIAMAKLAAGQAGSAEVKDLARRIAAAQQPEIEKMKAMAAAWKVTLDTGSGSMKGMSGGGTDDVSALTPLTGAAFDKEFLTRMTAHHSSAVEMARAELAQGSNPQAKQLATSIVAVQEKEIAEMRGLLAKV